VFLGNTAQFVVKAAGKERTGFLTIGSNADEILQRLVIALQQTAILYLDAPLIVYDDKGEKVEMQQQMPLPFSDMAAKKSGIVPWNGENYFFLNLQPFPNIDLHVFLLNPEEKEFAFLHELEAGSKKVVSSILWNIHIAGLIAMAIAIVLVNLISRKITKPIIQLAKATEDVAEGRLDQIKLTLPPLKHNDEIAVLCHSFEEMVKGLIEKEKVQGVLNKVVSREIAQEILKGTVHLGGEEKTVTVLFTDIREFTKMTQNMKPKEIIDLLNTCMTKISQIVDKNGGVIDKYVGDEAMALFGAPLSCDDAAMKAVRSAIEMVDDLKRWNKERTAQGQPPIEIGIGIHTGTMLAGNMGAENRLNYTVIGSNVNLASRLCKAAKRNEILISKQTLEEPFVKDAIRCEKIPLHTFKGFDQPIEVFLIQGFR
jgi:adenylate cyclase